MAYVYSDNFGQILYQGQQARDARRTQAEIAQLKYGNRGNGNSSSPQKDDALMWLKAGQEQAKLEAQQRVLGEQLAEQLRQQQRKMFGELDASKRAAEKAKKDFDTRAWLAMNGYWNTQIDPSAPTTWGQAFNEATGGIINERGQGIKYTLGSSDYDDLVKDNLALAMSNKGFSIDYGAEETTMNLGVDENLSTKEKFQKFGEQANAAFTPMRKDNKPLGEQHGVTEGANEATPTNSENQTTFEEGEYSSAVEATQSFTLEQLDDAFNKKDFSSFSPEAQKFIRNYLANTYVGYDKQGNPSIYNIGETFDYLTAAQAAEAERQGAASNNLNKAFPSFDEQRSMFPGAADDINKEQEQYNNAQAEDRKATQKRFEDTLSTMASAQIASNESDARSVTNDVIKRAHDIVKNPKSTPRDVYNALGTMSEMDNGIVKKPKYQEDNVKIARIGATASQKPQELTQKEQLSLSIFNNPDPKVKALRDKYGNGANNIDELTASIMSNATTEEIEDYLYALKNGQYNGRNVLNSTKTTLTADERKVVDAATNITSILEQYGTNEESTNWFKNMYRSVIDRLPANLKDALLGEDPAVQKTAMQKLLPIFAAGIGKQGAGATYLSTATIKSLNAAGLNDAAIMALVDQVYEISQNNLSNLSRSMNTNVYPVVANVESRLNAAKTRALIKTAAAVAKGLKDQDGEAIMFKPNPNDKEAPAQPAVRLTNGDVVSANDDGVVVVWRKGGWVNYKGNK